MKLFVLTTAALLTAGTAGAQTMSSPTTNPSAPAPVEPMTSPSATTPTSPSTTADAAANGAMTETMARQKLSGAGYGSVTGLKQNGNGDWEGVIKKGSKQQRVTVTADGTVSPLTPM
jgi:hypothetical protein